MDTVNSVNSEKLEIIMESALKLHEQLCDTDEDEFNYNLVERILEKVDKSYELLMEISKKNKEVQESVIAKEKSQLTKQDCLLTCDICTFQCITGRELKWHKLEHEIGIRFKCRFCTKDFASADDVIEHRLTFHKTVTYEYCSRCDKVFKNKQRLYIHMCSIHAGVRPYQCKFCPKTFLVAKALKRHQKSHMNPIPMCQKCDRQFTTLSHLNQHIKFKHLAKKKHKLDCTPCERVDKNIETFQCKLCPKTFDAAKSLKRHQKSHMNPIPMCHKCDREFSSESNLNQHIKYKHLAKKKKLDCTPCGRVYKNIDSLRRHNRKYHSKVDL